MKQLPKNHTYQDKHYTERDLQFIDIAYNMMTSKEFEGFCRGNILKYLLRYDRKRGLDDILKIQAYLDWLVFIVKDRENEYT